MNVQRTKRAMRDWMTKRKMTVAKMMYDSRVWGRGAMTNAWRITGRHGKASTQKAAVDRVLFPETLGQAIARVALSQVGVKENPAGSNSGAQVSRYQKVTGAFRAAWCGSFNAWCIVTAAAQLHRKAPQLSPNHAYVPDITNTIRNGVRGWHSVGFENAKAGDTVCLWSSGHVETVIKRDGDYLACVGGNTAPVGMNNHGGMVSHTRRHRSEVTVIGRAW